MHLTLSEKARYAAYLAAGVKVLVRGKQLTLDDVQVHDSDFQRNDTRPAASAPTPKDFAGALSLELKAGLPVKDAIQRAAEKHPTLYRQYCNELTDPAPAAPGPDSMPVERSYGADPAGAELARHIANGGALQPGAPGYREWIESFRRPE